MVVLTFGDETSLVLDARAAGVARRDRHLVAGAFLVVVIVAGATAALVRAVS